MEGRLELAPRVYGHRSTVEVVRALLVMRLCSMPYVVTHSKLLYNTSRRVLGNWLTERVLKNTLYAHFCGGETKQAVLPTMDGLNESGIGTILDYAVEADAPSADDTVEAYEGEPKCDQTLQICLECIEAAGQRPDGFAAVKLTGLGNPELLIRISSIITHIRRIFSNVFDTSLNVASPADTPPRRSAGVYSNVLMDSQFANQHHLNRGMTEEDFVQGMRALGVHIADAELRGIFKQIDTGVDGVVDFMEWIEFVQPTDVSYRPFFVASYDNMDPPLTVLTASEMEQMDRLVQRLYKLADFAFEKRVRLMVDAEHTYFQPAIDHLVLHLQRKYNASFPTVFNTYQSYLRDSYSRMWIDIERANKEGWYFAAKLVRGAYMNLERARALDIGVESPIHFNKMLTDASYNRNLEVVMRRANKYCLMVATHNEESVAHTIRLMHTHNTGGKDGLVFFAQLMGMCDHVTFTLAKEGYSALKYVPFGPVFEVVPYLIRRVEENGGIMGGAKKEQARLWRELGRRVGLVRD